MFVTNFQTKANIFNNHFVEQCLLISNDSVLQIPVSRCNSSLYSVEITGENILSIIRSLDPKKAHSWDDISVVLEGHFWPDSSRIGRIVLFSSRIVLFSSRIDCSDSRIDCL